MLGLQETTEHLFQSRRGFLIVKRDPASRLDLLVLVFDPLLDDLITGVQPRVDGSLLRCEPLLELSLQCLNDLVRRRARSKCASVGGKRRSNRGGIFLRRGAANYVASSRCVCTPS